MQQITILSERSKKVTAAIQFWIKNKGRPGKSEKTVSLYLDYITKLRITINNAGYDLDGLPLIENYTSQDKEEAITKLSMMIELWATYTEHEREPGKGITKATFNQRLSVISSFYIFVSRRGFLPMSNPVDLIDRMEVQDYANSQSFSNKTIIKAIGSMDREKLDGKRDYALFLIFISTGRRASEILKLVWKDIEIQDNRMLVHFHCKGDKMMHDYLEPRVQKAVEDYMEATFQNSLLPEQKIWLSLSNRNYKKPLTQRGLADIFQKRIGTMRIHRTRHTFAHRMMKSGADMRNIQEKLGHNSIATTEKYLRSLTSPENEFAGKLLDDLEIE